MGRARSASAGIALAATLSVIVPLIGLSNIRAAAAAPPSNDDRADARVLVGRSGALTQTTIGATPESGIGENTGQATVWFRWRATHTGWETFLTSGSQAPTALVVYPPGSRFWANLFGTGASDLWYPNGYPGSYAKRFVRVVQGRVYYVQLTTTAASANTVRLRWQPGGPPSRPANDDLAGARPLTGRAGIVTGSLTNASYQPGESPLLRECGSCAHSQGDFGPSVWFRWTAPANGTWRLHNGQLGAWSWIQVYRGGPTIENLTLVKQGIGYPGSYPSTLIDVPVRGGTTYRIRYSSWSESGPFKLSWAPATTHPTPPPPGNDGFAQALNLPNSAMGAIAGTSQWATRQAGEPRPDTTVDSTVWYRWTSPTTGLATIGSPQYSMSTKVWTGGSLSTLQAVPATYWGEPTRRPTVSVEAGTTYYIQMGGSYSSGGRFTLTWDTTVPPNDHLADAHVLPPGPTGISPRWGVVRSTAEPGEPPTYGDPVAQNTVWMRWTPARSGRVSFHTFGDHVPTLDVFTGPTRPTFGSLARVGSGPHGVEFDAVAGKTYWVRLHAELASIGYVSWHQRWDYTRPTVGALLDGGARVTTNPWVQLKVTGSDVGSGLQGWYVSMAAYNGQVLAPAWLPARGQTSRIVRWSVTHTAYGGRPVRGVKSVHIQAVDNQGTRSAVIRRTITYSP